MWTYLAYILNSLSIKFKTDKIYQTDLRKFIFKNLFQEKLVFWDGVPDLWGDVEYIAHLGLIKDNVTHILIIDSEKLNNISNIVSKSYVNVKVPLLQEYVDRIDRALKGFMIVYTRVN